MGTAGFEPTIPASERPYTDAIDGEDTWINLRGSHIRKKKCIGGGAFVPLMLPKLRLCYQGRTIFFFLRLSSEKKCG